MTNEKNSVIIPKHVDGRLAQLGEHLPYKQRVTGSSPVLSTRGKDRVSVRYADGGLEGETVQSKLPVDVCDRGRPSAQFARESSPVLSTKK